MAGILFTNFARSQLAAPLLAGDLSLTVETGHGARFPSPGVGEYFYLVLENAALDREIVKCTGRAVDTLTIVRAQDNTTALGWNAGDVVALRMVAAALADAMAIASGADYALLSGAAFTGAVSMAALLSANGGVAVPVDATGVNARRAEQTIWNVAGAARIPTWATAGRPATPSAGDTGFNTDLGSNETYNGTIWVQEAIQNQATVATTSGTSVDITGIPAGIKRLIVKLVGVSTNGTSDKVIRLGTSGGVLATGYLTGLLWVTTTSPGASSPLTTGWQFSSALAADALSGALVLDLHGTDTWVATGGGSVTNRAHAFVFTGSVDVGGVLDRIRITTLGGTDAFDAGEISLSWEF